MGLNADGANLLLGKGKVFFDRFNANGVSTGLRFLGNVTALAMTTSDDVKEAYSSAEAGAPLLKSALIKRTIEVSLTMGEFTAENVALALMGTEGYQAARTTAAVAAYDLGIAAVDRTYKFADDGPIKASPAPVIKIGTGTALTANTDYVLDLARGTVYLKSNATTLAGVDGTKKLNVAYSTDDVVASTNARVNAGISGTIEGMLQFIADPSSGPKWDIDIWRVDFTPDGEFGVIGEDFGEFKIKGKVVSDANLHPTESLYRLIKR